MQRLLAHLRWADERALAALRGAASPPAEALKVYAHILAAEHVWLTRLRFEPAALPVWPTLDLEECARLARENAAGLESFVGELTEADLRREISYRTSAGQHFQSTMVDILLHLVMHGSYHRGQIALLLRQGGAEPAATDYIVFLREPLAGASRPA